MGTDGLEAAMISFRAKVPACGLATSPYRSTKGLNLRLVKAEGEDVNIALEIERKERARGTISLEAWLLIRHPASNGEPVGNLVVASAGAGSRQRDMERFGKILISEGEQRGIIKFPRLPVGVGSLLKRGHFVRDGHLIVLISVKVKDGVAIFSSEDNVRHLKRRTASRNSTFNEKTKRSSIAWVSHEQQREHFWPIPREFSRGPHCGEYVDSWDCMKEIESTDNHQEAFSFSRSQYTFLSLLGRDTERCSIRETLNVESRHTNFADVTLSVGDKPEAKIFYLHRCVLALASPVLRVMLSTNMKESRTGSISLASYSPECISFAIHYMYGGRIPRFPPEYAFEMYRFSHQYQVSNLLITARTSILDNLSALSAVDTLSFASLFEDEQLLRAARLYIADNFSSMVSSRTLLSTICSLPPNHMYCLLESDRVRATEFEIFLVAMRWIVAQGENAHIDGVLRRIRFSLLTSDMAKVVSRSKIACRSPNFHRILDLSELSANDTAVKSHPERRRFIGRPTVTIWVPCVPKPPRAALRNSHFREPSRRHGVARCQGPPFVIVNKYQGLSSVPLQATFEHSGLRWIFSAEMKRCGAWRCDESRLSVSLWLDQDDRGNVWQKGNHRMIKGATAVRIAARVSVCTALGGQLHTRALDVVFRASGWANGWTIQDVFGGHQRQGSFLSLLSSKFPDSQVLLVAVEIYECEIVVNDT